MRLRARSAAAGAAAALWLVCGSAVAAADGAADGAAASRTPLADTGLWEPPVLAPREDGDHPYKNIPADEGVAVFYGRHVAGSRHEIPLISHIRIDRHDIRYFGRDIEWPTYDTFLQYRVVHQGENYILVKYRRFPDRLFQESFGKHRDYAKGVGFGLLASLGGLIHISLCDSVLSDLFEPDNYDQTPEKDIAELIESGADEAIRREFAKGYVNCNGGGGGAYYEW